MKSIFIPITIFFIFLIKLNFIVILFLILIFIIFIFSFIKLNSRIKIFSNYEKFIIKNIFSFFLFFFLFLKILINFFNHGDSWILIIIVFKRFLISISLILYSFFNYVFNQFENFKFKNKINDFIFNWLKNILKPNNKIISIAAFPGLIISINLKNHSLEDGIIWSPTFKFYDEIGPVHAAIIEKEIENMGFDAIGYVSKWQFFHPRDKTVKEFNNYINHLGSISISKEYIPDKKFEFLITEETVELFYERPKQWYGIETFFYSL